MTHNAHRTVSCYACAGILLGLLLIGALILAAQPGSAQGRAPWFDHFDGDDGPPGGWERRWKSTNGPPFLTLWLPGHVETSHAGTYLRLRLDDRGDDGAPCLPDNPDCTILDPTLGNITYRYTAGEYRTTAKFGYGCFEASLRGSALDGTVTAFFLYSDVEPWDDVPDIDWEIFGNSRAGGDNALHVQTNYFDGSGSGHEQMVDLGFDPTTDFYTYGIEWLASPDGDPEKSLISWYLVSSHRPVRLRSAIANFGERDGMKVMLSHWATDSTWNDPGVFDPQPEELPAYAVYDWVRYRIPDSSLGCLPSMIWLPVIVKSQ